ncbi:hypothetical protein V6N11_010994 [Hibiscus sabdariffa]|uniref:Uncharacterized protein n=1 Tax=Hibiscus sabdariffa TaxID=183260 RepID=A0ABR2S740_9ROSI
MLARVGCSCTNLTIEQQNELLAMEESLKQLADRAAKAVEDKNRHTANESMKKTVTCNLECNLNKYKEVESEVKQMEQKLTALQEQVEEAKRKRESVLTEQERIFRSSKKMKMELEALEKEWAECESKGKVAEYEEKTVEAEWERIKHFISSIKEDIKRALEKYGGEKKIRLKKKQEEKEQKRKEKAEAGLYTVIKVSLHGGPTEVKNCYSRVARQFSSHRMRFDEGYLYVSHSVDRLSNTGLPGTRLGSLTRIHHLYIQMILMTRSISIYC